MTSRIPIVAAAALLTLVSMFGGLIVLASLSGHPPEWLLDAYYSIAPSADPSGAMLIVGLIGLLSLGNFGVAFMLFRRKNSSIP
jgi:hypothetical protein